MSNVTEGKITNFIFIVDVDYYKFKLDIKCEEGD